MIIEDKRTKKNVREFGDLFNGTVFIWNGEYCIKTRENYTDLTNATVLSDGAQLQFDYEAEVEVVNAKVIIMNEGEI